MEKIMLVGRTGVGKTSFCQAMKGETLHYHKTQAVQLLDNAIDTPGEYIENRALYRALIVTAAEADLIVLMQDCTDEQCVFAPGFTSMFGNRPWGLLRKRIWRQTGRRWRMPGKSWSWLDVRRYFISVTQSGKGLKK